MAGIDALKQFDQWINYKLVPKDNGKTDKIPVSPHSGNVCGAQSPENWTSYDQALSTGLPVGFVFTEQDPFFFLDLDDCRNPDGSWDDVANYACNIFAGCAFEISQSGNGLHGFGVAPVVAPHGCNSDTLHSQFYTSNRFCAITDNATIGDAGFLPSKEIYQQFVNYYFPGDCGGPTRETEQTWDSGPCPEWSGPVDDIELITMAMKSQSAKSAMGVAASFAELWEGDPEVLARYYPSDRDRFDWSKADAAICGHLAFWTGKDHERIRKLWGLSALGQREKFLTRPKYQNSTIAGACQVSSVYTKGTAQPQTQGEDGEKYGYPILFGTEMEELFEGCVYVRDMHKVFVPDGGMLKPETFRATFGGSVFAVDEAARKTTRNAWAAFSESQIFTMPQAVGTCFEPKRPRGEIITKGGVPCVNVYVPPQVQSTEGDAGPFFDLLYRMLPNEKDRTILLSYMAAVVQHQGEKFRWAPVLQGVEGNGKSTIGNILQYCVGEKYVHTVNMNDIESSFNAWLTNKILIIANEMGESSGKNVITSLKEVITEPRISVQAKGRDQVTMDNMANFMFCMNNKNSVKKHKNDRRFCVFYTAQQEVEDITSCGMSGRYFINLYDWLGNGGYAIINNFLQTWQIPEEFNPAGYCKRAPDTSSTNEAVIESRSSMAQCVLDAVEDGKPGFYNGWVSSVAVGRLLKEEGYRVAGNRIPKILAEINYTKHPSLPEGKTSRMLPSEGGRPRLYMIKGHYTSQLVDPGEITNQYCKDQGYPELI